MGGMVFGVGGVVGVFVGAVLLASALLIALRVRVEAPEHRAGASPTSEPVTDPV